MVFSCYKSFPKMPVLFISCILFFSNSGISPNIDTETLSEKDFFTHSIKTLQEEYYSGDTLKILVNGFFETDGDCGSSLSLGLLKIDEKQEWEVVKDIRNHPMMECGFTTRRFKKEVVELCIFDSFFLATQQPFKFSSGTYRFTALTGKRSRLIKSNVFTIRI